MIVPGQRSVRFRMLGKAVAAAAPFFWISPAFPACVGQPAELDARPALIVADLQRSILARPTLRPVAEIAANARQLVDLFRARSLPIVFVQSASQPQGRVQRAHASSAKADARLFEILPTLGQRTGDHVVSKGGWSAFSRTDLAQFLQARSVTQVVLLGYSTSIAVESTAREAYDRGYSVTVVSDATTDTDLAAHQTAMLTIFPRLGQVATTDELSGCLSEATAATRRP